VLIFIFVLYFCPSAWVYQECKTSGGATEDDPWGERNTGGANSEHNQWRRICEYLSPFNI